MIGPLVDAIGRLVVDPQCAEGVDPLRRAYHDREHVPVDEHAQTVEVLGTTTAPVNPELGSSGVLSLRHVIAVVVTVESATVGDALMRRDLIVTDLARRVVPIEWENVPIELDGEPLDVTRVLWAVDYADQDQGNIAAWATLTFTIDTEWRP